MFPFFSFVFVFFGGGGRGGEGAGYIFLEATTHSVLKQSVKGSGNSTFLQKDQLCYLKRAEKLTFCIYFS